MDLNNIVVVYAILIGVAYTCFAFLIFEAVRVRKRDKDFKTFVLNKIREKEEK